MDLSITVNGIKFPNPFLLGSGPPGTNARVIAKSYDAGWGGAVANGYFVGAINRVGHEQPWDIGEFYGQSYFCDPRGQIIAEAPRDQDAVVVADLNLDLIREVRNTWQFFRDRRPDSYGQLVAD